jgi:hypothetical protein
MRAPERKPESVPAQSRHPLAFGRSLQLDSNLGTVEITNPDGLVELSVRCTAEGCELRFASARLALSSPGRLEAEQRLELNSGGDYASRIGGSASTSISGRLETEADEVFLHSQRGDALIQANDYVRLVGEKVLLNSEQERRPARDQLEAFWRKLGL